MVCIVMIEPVLQGVGMDSIEDKVREVVDEDVPVSPQNTDPHKTSLLPQVVSMHLLFFIIHLFQLL